MTMSTPPSATPGVAGMRRLTPQILASLRKEREEAELPMASRRKAVGALRRALPGLQLPLSARALIEELVRLSPPEDWENGRSPIVWPSNAHLCHRLGLSRASIQRALRLLQEADLIIVRDGPAGRRFGARDGNGHIQAAHGFDLSRLARRAGELEALARDSEATRHAIAARRRAITVGRRMVRALLSAANEVQPADPVALRRVEAELDQLERDAGSAILVPSKIPDARGAEIAWLASQINALVARAEAAFHGSTSRPNPQESRPSGHANEADSRDTKGINSLDCNATRNLRPDEASEADGRAMHSEHGFVRDTEPAAVPHGPQMPQDYAKTAPVSHKGSPEKAQRALPLSAGGLLASCPELQVWAGSTRFRRIEDISRFFEAEGLKLLGISVDAWAEAVEAMGREQATAAVSIILQRVCEAAVDSPGGYLRGMSAKARAGKLDLSTTLRWMALKRAGGR
jgi:replication initiation protein RepC